MALFDQWGQRVTCQYNAAGDINVSVQQGEEPCVVIEPARSGPYANYGRQLMGLTMQNVGGAPALNIRIGTCPDADVIPTLASGHREFIRVPPPMEAFREHVLRKVDGEYQLALDPNSAQTLVILTIVFEDFAQQRYFVREKITPHSHEIIARGKFSEDAMAIFDQRGQQVTYQYNAAGDINFGAVQNRIDLVGELGKLQREMTQAKEAGVFDEGVATDAEYQLTKAVQEAKKPAPDKGTVLGHLTSAKTLVEGVAAARGLVTALTKAVKLVQRFF